MNAVEVPFGHTLGRINLSSVTAQSALVPLIERRGRASELVRNKKDTTRSSRSDFQKATDAGLRVAVAASPVHLQAAKELVRVRYAWRGYDLTASASEELDVQSIQEPVSHRVV